jgi:hypothetical protein
VIDEKWLGEWLEETQRERSAFVRDTHLETIRLCKLGLWAEKHGIPEMRTASEILDSIKYELEASVYTVVDDEFDRVFAARDLLDNALATLPKPGESK